jgi:prevent-host-death family protein
MKTGIRKVRQNLSVLLEEVKKGHEIVITDRGRPVARLIPYRELSDQPFPDLEEFRSSMPRLDPPLSETVIEDREDRV